MEKNEKDFGQERHLFLTVKQVDQQNPNIVHATVSTDEIDRYDEVVTPDAFKEAMPSFLANPVVLPAHQHKLENGEPPVIGVVLTTSIKVLAHNVEMDIEFDDDDLGQKYARKYQKKIMRAFSIGFRGLEGEYTNADGRRIWQWLKIELLEVSSVAVPANRGALARAYGFYELEEKSDITAVLLEALDEKICDLTNTVKGFINNGFDEIKSLIIADPDDLAERLLGVNSDPAAAGGDKNVTEQQLLSVLQKVIKEVRS